MLKHPSFAWKNWPRETRDCLFLLSVIALTVAPLMAHLPLWCAGLIAAVLIWRCQLAWQRRSLPPKWMVVALLTLAVLATWWHFRTIIGRDPGVTLIIVLLSLKTLEWHHRRDAFVVFFLAFFVMLTNFFFSQSLLTALCMVLALWGWLTALILMHRPVGIPRIADVARSAAAMSLLGAPFMVILFVLFPRFAPLWSLPASPSSGRSGLSNSMQVGSIARVALDDSVAMRVKWLDKNPPSQQHLYFRGPVLSVFDSKQWLPAPLASRAAPVLEVVGQSVTYQVTLEPHELNALLTLDATAKAPQLTGMTVRVTPQMQWVATQAITSLAQYNATSYPIYRLDPQGHAVQEVEKDLPSGLNPRTVALAQEIVSQHPYQASARVLALSVLERLRTGGYTYTLDPGEFGEHSADEFWFDRKRGFCEHIATSFVILMRAMQVPARVVTGYQGGERNPVDGMWTVRQSDAHAWTEIWQPSEGWIRVDPTAAVAPSRVGELARLVPAPGFIRSFVTGVMNPVAPDFFYQVRALWEATNNVWNQQILSYTQNQQMQLLGSLGFAVPSWQDLIKLLGWMLGITALLGVAITRLERRQKKDLWIILLNRAKQNIIARGLVLPPHPTPRDMRHCIQIQWGDNAASVTQWFEQMEVMRYSIASPHSALMLARQYKQLNWPE